MTSRWTSLFMIAYIWSFLLAQVFMITGNYGKAATFDLNALIMLIVEWRYAWQLHTHQ